VSDAPFAAPAIYLRTFFARHRFTSPPAGSPTPHARIERMVPSNSSPSQSDFRLATMPSRERIASAMDAFVAIRTRVLFGMEQIGPFDRFVCIAGLRWELGVRWLRETFAPAKRGRARSRL
jgi:hypothetical protein